LLPNNGFCNLVELDVSKFNGDDRGMHRAIRLIARANYRQTVVNLNDGILQSSWHQQNEYLRLCGVGLTGIARRPDMTHWDFRQLRNSAVSAAYSMADELELERPKNVTCIKPSGTMSKAFFDTTEGAHRPKARYIFNNISFSRHDPLVPILVEARYRVVDHPTDRGAVLVSFPVSYPDLKFDRWNGHDVDRESAVDQLERYRLLNTSYVEQNTSITVSWDVGEMKQIVDWLDRYWDSYVATSFLFRNDPTKTAADLGYVYMPQECVTREEYEAYAATILPVSIEDEVKEAGIYELDSAAEECATGACPVR
jgi:ribonucleoside-triphosphate reductase